MFLIANITLATVALLCIVVVLWLACAFYAAGRANNNGANYYYWTMIGLLSGPIGAAVAFFYFRAESERSRTRRYSEDGKGDVPKMISCPNCGESIPRVYEACQFCGKPVLKHRR
jgi:ribosomal protein L32